MKIRSHMWLVLLACLWCMGLGSAVADETPGKPVVIDVRTPAEFGENHLVGASNLDFTAADFAEQAGKLDKSATYRLYCRTGNRSTQAAEVMKKLGFKDVQSVGSLKDAAGKLQMQCVAGSC